MSTYKVSKADIELKQFICANIVDGIGFKTLELANEYVRLRKATWSNLVCIGIARSKGLYIPEFNVFD